MSERERGEEEAVIEGSKGTGGMEVPTPFERSNLAMDLAWEICIFLLTQYMIKASVIPILPSTRNLRIGIFKKNKPGHFPLGHGRHSLT